MFIFLLSGRFCCLGFSGVIFFAVWAGAFFFFAVWAGAQAPPKQQKKKTRPRPNSKKKRAPAPSERVDFLLFGRVGVFIFLAVWAGGVFFFCCLGGGQKRPNSKKKKKRVPLWGLRAGMNKVRIKSAAQHIIWPVCKQVARSAVNVQHITSSLCVYGTHRRVHCVRIGRAFNLRPSYTCLEVVVALLRAYDL